MSTESIVLRSGVAVEESASKEELGTFRQQVISLLTEIFFAVPNALFWRDFITDVEEWAESGETSRFAKSDRPDSVLDKQTGKLWPIRVIRGLSGMSDLD